MKCSYNEDGGHQAESGVAEAVYVPRKSRAHLSLPLPSAPQTSKRCHQGEPTGPGGQRSCWPAQLPHRAWRMEVTGEGRQLDSCPRAPSNSQRIFIPSLEQYESLTVISVLFLYSFVHSFILHSTVISWLHLGAVAPDVDQL